MISKRNPFLPPLPDDRISLCVYADETGLRYWNRSSDPMPIKTINMNGLQKWEETDDYIIYLDKDAVMTTVESYVTGTYDLFLDRKADVDGAMELLKINNIEWTSEDDSKLILDINKAQLERITNTPTTMEDEDFAPQTFETRAVPTTYECCFRVDKSSGEIYIGEGYENLWTKSTFENSSTVTVSVLNTETNHIKVVQKTSPTSVFNFYRSTTPNFNGVENYSSSLLVTQANKNSYVMYAGARHTNFNLNEYFIMNEISRAGNTYLGIGLGSTSNIGDYIVAKHFQITKTSTPKPFVKSIMPSGKLAFVTSAHWNTHSFLIKKFRGFGKNYDGNCRILNTDKGGVTITDVRPLFANNKTAAVFVSNTQRVLVDEDYVKYDSDNSSSAVKNTFTLTAQPTKLHPESFKQLLIYKGNLSEAELKAENEKDIRLK